MADLIDMRRGTAMKFLDRAISGHARHRSLVGRRTAISQIARGVAKLLLQLGDPPKQILFVPFEARDTIVALGHGRGFLFETPDLLVRRANPLAKRGHLRPIAR